MKSPPVEKREPNEAALVAEMIAILRRKMARDYAKGGTLRDAHPKTLGLLRGSFRIRPNLPEALRVGLFEKPRSFDCWVRFSSSSGKVQSDAVPDARGVAIKLLAPRSKGAAAGAELGQDFVLLNTPVMPLGTVALFRDAVYYTIESSPLLLAAKFALTGHAGVLLGLLMLRGRSTRRCPDSGTGVTSAPDRPETALRSAYDVYRHTCDTSSARPWGRTTRNHAQTVGAVSADLTDLEPAGLCVNCSALAMKA